MELVGSSMRMWINTVKKQQIRVNYGPVMHHDSIELALCSSERSTTVSVKLKRAVITLFKPSPVVLPLM